MNKPLLAITLGDPAGVGPEVIAGVWPEPRLHEICRPLVIGHPGIMRRAIELWQCPARLAEVDSPEDALPTADTIPCLAVGGPEVLEVRPATVDARAGQAAYEALVLAARLALAGRIDGLVTAPLNKAALWQAGHHYPGHTELLAELCGVPDFAMMLYLPPGPGIQGSAGLGVVHVTLHMALRQALEAVTTSAVAAKIRLADRIMRTLKSAPPRIGVAALNPHAGESGLFGDEESRIIAPAVSEASAAGIHVIGPLPADTLMVRAAAGDFDGVVAMYHDQGHIALKLLGMHRAVNVTLGLPIVRTSVAHGTAFDLAWQKLANPSSMLEAIRVAAQLAGKSPGAEASR
ncbi:MAG TPA: 4-hydroxythreonine-4-phosphate dehydrogenase PdxA [Pirellulales bacterium]|jgi:4-hydroxythreonine-4-phosphate dehydrogenase|nr:4-hydroxythreonine-4-phosphate dehydrogenase PdxA [Pirellulales bacterium]